MLVKILTSFVVIILLGILWYGQEENVGSDTTEETAAKKQNAVNAKTQRKITILTGKMIRVASGDFEMGSNRTSYEKPVHTVKIKEFRMGQKEVTQKQWQEIMYEKPSFFNNCDNCPVEKVSWDDVQLYIKRLNKRTGKDFRLPSEAEWEYTCRNRGKNQIYCGSDSVGIAAWYFGNSSSRPHEVGLKKANGLNIKDMTGNVAEWVEDCWNESYEGAPIDGSAWLEGDCKHHIIRGGSWGDKSYDLRAVYRNWAVGSQRYFAYGFRLAHDASTF